MGTEYQERLGLLLLTWMNMKIADELKIIEMIEGRLGIEEYLERESGERNASDDLDQA